MEARQATLGVEQSKRIPDVTVSGGVRYFNETEDPGFIVKLSLPLLLFDYNQGGVLEARYRLAQAEEERRATEVRISVALAEAYQRLITAYRDITGIQRDVLPPQRRPLRSRQRGIVRENSASSMSWMPSGRSLIRRANILMRS